MQCLEHSAGCLKKIYYGELLCLLGTVAASVLAAFLGQVLSLVGTVLVLVGLYRLSKDAPCCRRPFLLSLLTLLIRAAGAFFLPAVLGLASTALHCLAVYAAFGAVLEVLEDLGLCQAAEEGRPLSRLYLSCGISSILLAVMTALPALERIYIVLAAASALADFLSTMLYLFFLMRSHKAITEEKLEA